MRKKGNYGIGMARKGSTKIASYEGKHSFDSPGHKRQGDNRIMNYPDVSKSDMNPGYCGGTDGSAKGNIPE